MGWGWGVEAMVGRRGGGGGVGEGAVGVCVCACTGGGGAEGSWRLALVWLLWPCVRVAFGERAWGGWGRGVRVGWFGGEKKSRNPQTWPGAI